jgi:hypothetical protein
MNEMLFNILVIGSLPFWILAGACTAVLVGSVERDQGWFTSLFVGAVLVALAAFSSFNPFHWAVEHYNQVILVSVLYLIIGTVVWAPLKWVFFVKKVTKKLAKEKSRWTKENGRQSHKKDFDGVPIIETDEDYYKRFLRDVGHEFDVTPSDGSLQVSKNKGRIMVWLAYWPFSLFASIFSDLFRNVYEFLYERIAGALQAISDGMFSDLKKMPK